MTDPPRRVSVLDHLVVTISTMSSPRPAQTEMPEAPHDSQPAATPETMDRRATPDSGGKKTITVSIRANVRNRSRAAYKATSHLYDDESYSDFVDKAVDAEVSRRERLHNDGNPYPGGNANLPSGRPLGP